MQHLDEGTIHAWLDGALTPDEAARADAHVKDCAQCQAAVAEARGFIAASSRILTALDDAPRGVIPASATARQRTQPWIWRIAATVLVVATGTVLLVKERGSERASTVADSTTSSSGATAAPTAVSQNAAADAAMNQSLSRTTPAAPPAAMPSIATAPAPRAAAPSLERATDKKGLSAGNVGAGAAGARVTGDRRAEALSERSNVVDGIADAVDAARAPVAAPMNAPSPMAGRAFGSVSAVAAEPTPREVAVQRSLGKTQTFYELAPGDTVVLEEQVPASLEGVVVTGAATTRTQAQPSRAGKSAAQTESQQKVEALAAPPPPVPAMQDAATGGRHSISWLDPSTRRVVILSGQHSQEALQRIREQIQRLRDAAQPKRNPE
jgi:hypothetical protein